MHILSAEAPVIYVPTDRKVVSAVAFDDRKPVKFVRHQNGGVSLNLDSIPDTADYIVELTTK